MSRMSLAAVALVVAAVGCGEDPISPSSPPGVEPPQPSYTFQTVSRTHAEGIVGTAVSYEPTVLVIDGAGHPAASVLVRFAFVTEEPGARVGSISRYSALTNAEGIATAGEWTLSTTAGPSILRATIDGAGPLSFRADARPDAPVSLGWLPATPGQVGLAATTVQPPLVQVSDRFGNSVAGVTVTFTITAGGGTLDGAERVTTDHGTSALAWMLGSSVGPNTILASASGLPSIEFTIQAVEASTVYELTQVDGVGWDVASAFVAFTNDGRFVSHAKYGDGWVWDVAGTYVISGSTVVLTYDTGEEEMGTLVDGVLVLDRWDNPCVPARQWHYHQSA